MVAGKPVRLVDVARAAGVSQGTASNVFGRPHLVREEVRNHVRAVASQLGYQGPDPKGRLLRAGKVNAIGVATAEPLSYFFEDPFARVMMSGISDACDAAGAGIALVSAQNEERLAWNIQSAVVDGFVLFCIEGGARLVELTRQRQLPFVALELGLADPTISAIGVDNFAGAQMAAAHLVGLGHRRFAILAMPFTDDGGGRLDPAEIASAVYSDARDRAYGYFAALGQIGLKPAEVPIYQTLNDIASVENGLEALFAEPRPPTALLAMSDRIAMAALEWLRRRGFRVPEDVSVVGFDGVPDGERSSPPLTTVTQPIREIGRHAVEAILDDKGGVHREALPVTLTIRASTGPAPRRGRKR